MTTMTLQIRTPSGLVFQEDVIKITLQTELGMMEIEPKHANLLGTIKYSHIVAHTSRSESQTFIGREGMLYVDNATNTASLVMTECTKESDISLVSAKEYLALLEDQLKKKNDLSKFHVDFLEEERIALVKMVGDKH